MTLVGQLPPFEPGATFEDRYRIVRLLGHGGFGAVYEAEQATTGQSVALKVMVVPETGNRQNGSRVARFLREAKLCARLQHPNIVRLLDSGQTSTGALYTVFAFAPGQNLADVLTSEGALEPREARHLMLQVLDALACAHTQGIVHRDLKPSNIMVIPTGARRNAMLLDLGIGTVVKDEDDGTPPLTGTNDSLGTPGYGAPEQWRGAQPSPAADIFSWGLVFIECLTGKPVYSGASSAEIFYQLLSPDEVPLPESLRSHGLGELIRRATAKEAAERELDARSLFAQLENCRIDDLSMPSSAMGPANESFAARGDAALLSETQAQPGLRRPLRSEDYAVERRQVTAVCCQFAVHGDPERAADAEDVDECLRAAFVTSVSAAKRQGGRVASMLGDQILLYFGYPRAQENDVQRAARAALAIPAAIEAENAGLDPRELRASVRVGLHSGLVLIRSWSDTPGFGPVLGTTPRVAAALAAVAAPGSIVTSGETQQLLRSLFDLEPAATVKLDQAGELSPVFSLTRELDAASSPSTASGRAAPPLVGRSSELEVLLEGWRRTQTTGGQCAMVVGEPGIGKSRLTRELRDRLAKVEHGFVEVRCAPDAQNTALFPILECLQRLFGIDPSTDPERAGKCLEEQLEEHGLDLQATAALFYSVLGLRPPERYQLPDVSPQRQKELTLTAIASVFSAMAERRPMLLLVEDLHWADATTLAFLNQLVRDVPSMATFLVLTARPEFKPDFPMIGMLQLPLGRLERSQIGSLLTALVKGKRLPDAVIDQVAERTDGIPLFIEELTQMMLDSGVLRDDGDHYELHGTLSDAAIPNTLRALLTARLDRLERAKETAQLAAALGREFNIDVLSAASPNGAGAVQEDLDRLMQAGLVLRRRHQKKPVGTFKHALIRDAAYESLGRGARQSVHARIAEVLSQQFPEIERTRPDLLALHYAAADRKDLALGYAQRAAEQALGRSAYAEAIAHASNVLAWAASLDEATLAPASIAANGILSHALMATRGWTDPEVKATADRSATLLQQLDRRSPQRIPTLWSLFAYHHTASHRPAARATAEEMVALGEDLGDRLLQASAATVLGIALHAEGDFQGSRRALERALERYQPELHKLDGPKNGLDSLVLAKTLLGHLRFFGGEAEEAFGLVQSAVAWGRELNHVPSLAIGLLYGCQVFQFAGDRETVRSMTAEILALSDRYGLPAYEGYAAIIHAWAVDDEPRAKQMVALLTAMGSPLCLSYYGSLAAENMAKRGEFANAVACIDECLERCEKNQEYFYEAELHRRRALYRLSLTPNAEDARLSLERAASLAERQMIARVEVAARTELLQRYADQAQETRLERLFSEIPKLRTASGQTEKKETA
jgi:TOMM system kinase/cyclase fusion protein